MSSKIARNHRTNVKERCFMCDKNDLNCLENIISTAKMLLYNAKTHVKFGALASSSCIDDVDLQLDKDFDDYYALLKTINDDVDEAIQILDLADLKVFK